MYFVRHPQALHGWWMNLTRDPSAGIVKRLLVLRTSKARQLVEWAWDPAHLLWRRRPVLPVSNPPCSQMRLHSPKLPAHRLIAGL
jgi:hypothetical protein